MIPASSDDAFLICRVGGALGGLPLSLVIETMRPLPLQPVEGTPSFVSGVAVIRGAATPVLDLSSLLRSGSEPTSRWVTVRAGERAVALAVAGVMGVATIPADARTGLPPLLEGAAADALTSLAARDAHLYCFFERAHWLAPEVWAALSRGEG